MRTAEELQSELVRTRRRLYRLTGIMTFVFIACLVVVFAAVGGALVIVDKRAIRTLQSDQRDVAAAPQQRPGVPVAPAPPPATTVGARVGASAIVAAAPPNPPPQRRPQAPATTGTATAAIDPAPPPPVAQPPAPPPPATAPLPFNAKAPQTTDVKRLARTPRDRRHARDDSASADNARADNARADNVRHDERATVGAAPNDTMVRPNDARRPRAYARARPDDQEADRVPGPQRVIVVGPRPPYPQPDARDDDQGGPPRQHDLFGDLFGGIFGHHDQ